MQTFSQKKEAQLALKSNQKLAKRKDKNINSKIERKLAAYGLIGS